MLKFWKFIPFLKDFFLARDVLLSKKVIGVSLIVAYILFPFDIIPDFLAFFGILDDLMLATFVMGRIISIAPQNLKQKYNLLHI
jgi:uncharacterized membrane protein YkvA (DUF1232 family)